MCNSCYYIEHLWRSPDQIAGIDSTNHLFEDEGRLKAGRLDLVCTELDWNVKMYKWILCCTFY